MVAGGYITSQKKGIEFRQIVLEHIKKILEISTREFKKNYKREVIHKNFSQEIMEEDTRKCYIQSIENLAFILLPYFDEPMNEVYNQTIKWIGLEVYEYLAFNKESILKEYKLAYNDATDIDTETASKILIMKQLKAAKRLFRELNQLLKRNDYLKSGIYSEGDLDEEFDQSEEG